MILAARIPRSGERSFLCDSSSGEFDLELLSVRPFSSCFSCSLSPLVSIHRRRTLFVSSFLSRFSCPSALSLAFPSMDFGLFPFVLHIARLLPLFFLLSQSIHHSARFQRLLVPPLNLTPPS